jgi:hypothetical protein
MPAFGRVFPAEFYYCEIKMGVHCKKVFPIKAI